MKHMKKKKSESSSRSRDTETTKSKIQQIVLNSFGGTLFAWFLWISLERCTSSNNYTTSNKGWYKYVCINKHGQFNVLCFLLSCVRFSNVPFFIHVIGAKRPWTKEQKDAVERHFTRHIERFIPPTMKDIEKCLSQESKILKHRNKIQLRVYLSNMVKKRKQD